MKKCALVIIGLVILFALPAAAKAADGPIPLSWSWSQDMILGSDYINKIWVDFRMGYSCLEAHGILESHAGSHIAVSGAGHVDDNEVTVDMVGIFYKLRMVINLNGLAGNITFFSPTGENLGSRDISVSTIIYP